LDLPVTAFLGVLLGGRVPSIGVNSLRSISGGVNHPPRSDD
jgi:hypothetical protein